MLSLFCFFSLCWLGGSGAVAGSLYLYEVGVLFGQFFMFDLMSVFLSFVSMFLFVSLWSVSYKNSLICKMLILLSILSSILCYSCIHGLGFWVFYEVSILALLVLLMLESPYSERYIAGWYLIGYVVLTSLPMLLCICFLSSVGGSFKLVGLSVFPDVTFSVYLVLSVLFMTKMPLPPFHVWLPIVHAEATSVVSVCLSGYMMKLGVLGVCRFSYYILPDFVFSSYYMVCGVMLGCLFFLSACLELDGKRWLAFLSLSHMLVVCLFFCVGSWDSYGLPLLYCLGHGLSAGAVFLLLWLVYDMTGSRNWNVLKHGLSQGSVFSIIFVGCLCTVASLPPSLQFFCEVLVLVDGASVSYIFIVLLFFSMFLGGLVPVSLLGGVLSRHYSVRCMDIGLLSFSFSCLFLVIWSFVLFVVC